MTIAINTNHFLQPGGNDFIETTLIKIAASNPIHRFVFIVPDLPPGRAGVSENINFVVASPRANNPLMWTIWLNYTLPAIASKHQAALLIHWGNTCSLRTRIPQLMVIDDLSHLRFPTLFLKKQLYFLKKNMPTFLDRAAGVLAASGLLAREILQQYTVSKNKIREFWLTAGDLYQPVDYDQKEAIKEKYAEEKEYFLFIGQTAGFNNLENLLRAFSFFKKRQKSNMRLIITGKPIPEDGPFMYNFKTYKYRHEVSLLFDLPEKEQAKITGAAYAVLYPTSYDGTGIFALQAMQCGVPVVTSDVAAVKEWAADAVLYADPANFEDLAQKMMLLFKDEAFRAEQIGKAMSAIEKNETPGLDDLLKEWILSLK